MLLPGASLKRCLDTSSEPSSSIEVPSAKELLSAEVRRPPTSWRTIMAFSSFLFFLLAVSATATELFDLVLDAFEQRSDLEQRSINPNMINYTASQFLQYGAQGVQIKYGPFTTYAASNNSGMVDYTQTAILQPCKDCLITFMQAGLEYPNGTYANTNTGIMLHHIVMYENGNRDSTCPRIPSRFFASGNERTPIDLTVNGSSKTGYYIKPNASMGLLTELMNELEDTRDVTVTVNFEYIPGMPSGFTALNSWWLDVSGPCGDSDEPVPAPPNDVIFNYTSPTPYTTTYGGTIVAMGGHMHDGGVLLTVSDNGHIICNFTPTYAATPGYVDGAPMNMTTSYPMDMDHLSNITVCDFPGTFKEGDQFNLEVYYNSTAHPLMLNMTSGTPDPVMGISIMYVTNGTVINGTSPSSGGAPVPSGSSTGSGTTSSSTSSSTSTSGANTLSIGSTLAFVVAALSVLIVW